MCQLTASTSSGVSMTRSSVDRLCPVLAAIGLLTLGCGGGGGDGGTPPPTTAIAKTSANSGDAQSGTVGEALAAPLQVIVTEGGTPSVGTTVTWSTTAQNASLSETSTPTDANGVATTDWTLGTVAGTQSAQAALTGASGSPVTFTATAAADAPVSLTKVSGDAQVAPVNTQLPDALEAKVSDQFGNGIPGVTVNWGAFGDATVSATTVPTNSSGISPVTVTLGSTEGPITISASADVVPGTLLDFTATATAASTTADITVANNSFTPKTITIAAGTTVTWTWTGTALQHNVVPDATQPTTSGTPVNGPHTYDFTFNTPGTYLYYCSNHGAAGGIGMSGTITVQ
jgi:plastocyanin